MYSDYLFRLIVWAILFESKFCLISFIISEADDKLFTLVKYNKIGMGVCFTSLAAPQGCWRDMSRGNLPNSRRKGWGGRFLAILNLCHCSLLRAIALQDFGVIDRAFPITGRGHLLAAKRA